MVQRRILTRFAALKQSKILRKNCNDFGKCRPSRKIVTSTAMILVSTEDDDLLAHGFSEWSSINISQLPVAVAFPRSTTEVSKIAQICHKYRMPMIPYSGGSSLEANFAAPHGGMSIDFAFMDRIIDLHEDDMDVVVQPSVSQVCSGCSSMMPSKTLDFSFPSTQVQVPK